MTSGSTISVRRAISAIRTHNCHAACGDRGNQTGHRKIRPAPGGASTRLCNRQCQDERRLTEALPICKLKAHSLLIYWIAWDRARGSAIAEPHGFACAAICDRGYTGSGSTCSMASGAEFSLIKIQYKLKPVIPFTRVPPIRLGEGWQIYLPAQAPETRQAANQRPASKRSGAILRTDGC